MDTLPLPPSPNLEQYQRRAKDLVKAAGSKQPGAVRAWAADWLRALSTSLGVTVASSVQPAVDRAIAAIEQRVRAKVDAAIASNEDFALADAHFFIASAHGFGSWAEFARHVGTPADRDPEVRDFEAAVDAVVDGDLAALERLVRQRPDLVRERSARQHRATLLHYVAANGVEDYRQRTPPNAVAVARFLLEAGAEVDALANTYSGSWYETTMNLLVSSAHPAGAGLQGSLVDVLVDFGAAVNGLKNDETPLLTALDFGYIEPAETLVRRGARVDGVVTAAALGRADLVSRFVIDKETLKPGVPLIAPPWRVLPPDQKTHIELALVWAAKFARTEIAERLLDLGVDPTAKDGYKMTVLHWAAANGCMTLIGRLLELGAPLEVENIWGGTVLDSAMHFVLHQPVKGVDYGAVFELLLAAAANPLAVDQAPSGNERVDEVLRRYRAEWLSRGV